MSRYAGNSEACPRCGLRYGRFRIGVTFEEVRQSMWSYSDDPTTWRYKRRGSILGKMHQWKLEAWREHLSRCDGTRYVELERGRRAMEMAHELTEDLRARAGF